MEKIVIQPSIKPVLFFIGLTVLGSTPFWVGNHAVPYWAGAILYLLGIGVLFTLKKIEITPNQVSVHYLLLFKQVVCTRDQIESITIGLLGQTTASAIGLMKRGEIIRIQSTLHRPVSITSTMDNRFKEIVVFLEDYYGDKIRS
jgi:hypothetical protein